jgi:glycosyltransferase involved in cell wall biosynthesis
MGASGLPRSNKDQIPERGARMARRDDREYREYLREEQRSQPGCPARKLALDRPRPATGLGAARSNGDVSGLRIAHLIESDGPGGAERVVVHLATSLQASGASNVVFLPADGEGWLARELEGSGVTIEYFRLDRPVSPECARSLAAAFRRHRIVLAHSHEFSMAVYGAWASWRAAIPHVITMHGRRYYADRLRRRLAMRAAIALSGRTVAVSSLMASQISHDLWIPSRRIATIANGVRFVPPERTTLREELQLDPDDRLLVSVGNLYPVKGHQHLIDALALLAVRHPNLHLAISGRGELADPLATRARSHGLADRVHLLGLRSDVPAVLAAADVFVLPSLSEGLPLALLEAMFAGRPIVATDVGEVSVALAQGDAGVLVEAGNPDALAAALDRLLSDPARASDLGERAAGRARAEYDVSHMVRRYVSSYEELLGRRANVLARSWVAEARSSF